MNSETRLVSGADLKAWVVQVFMRVSVPEDDAVTAADALVGANLRGVDTHGVVRLPVNVKRLQAGAVNPRPNIRVEGDSPAAILVEGDNGMGMVVGAWAMREAIHRARENGAAVVVARHSNHFGVAAHYAQMATAADMIGLSFTNTDASMAPWGSLTAYLGTNPLAFAAPGGIKGGIVVDMATSQVSWGKVMLAALEGRKIPLNWATDQAGRPTDDASKAVKGLMLPLGGYKGLGLALMIEILCGVLSGSSFGPHIIDDTVEPYHPQDVGHAFAAIDIERFMPVAQFKARMKQIVDEIHACEPAESGKRIYVPGEIEMETSARRRREGVPISSAVTADLEALGEMVGGLFLQMKGEFAPEIHRSSGYADAS